MMVCYRGKCLHIKWLAVALGALLLMGGTTGRAEDADQKEIAHLLAFVGHSECIFIRNGDEHDAVAARAHLERKYEYLQDRIATSEDFIRLTATRSSLSGRLYKVRCGDEEQPCAEWLQTELTRWRGLTKQ